MCVHVCVCVCMCVCVCRDRILAHVPAGVSFTPLMSLYLTDETTPEEITRAKASGHICVCVSMIHGCV